MRVRIVIASLVLGLCVFGCTQKKINLPEYDYAPTAPVFEDTGKASVSMSMDRAKNYDSVSDALWKEGIKAAGNRALTKLMNRELLFTPSNNAANIDLNNLFIKEGVANTKFNSVIGEYSQNFDLTIKFIPDTSVMGKVAGFKDGYLFGTEFTKVFVNVFTNKSITYPAFFVVARQHWQGHKMFLKVIGSGKLTNTAGTNVILNGKKDIVGKTVTVAQGELLQDVQEIQPDDIIFLSQVTVKADTAKKATHRKASGKRRVKHRRAKIVK